MFQWFFYSFLTPPPIIVFLTFKLIFILKVKLSNSHSINNLLGDNIIQL